MNTYYNKTTAVIEDNNDVEEVFNLQLALDQGEPQTFREALNSPERKEWIGAMKGEIENFLQRKVWTPTKIKDLRKGQKPIKVKWVFKKKNEQDGTIRFKGRIVVKGFVQIPGIVFTNTHSPVAQDSAIKIVLCISMFLDDWKVEMIDIEAAFLEAELDEDMYI